MMRTAIPTQTKELAMIDKEVTRDEIELAMSAMGNYEREIHSDTHECTDCDPSAPCTDCEEHANLQPRIRGGAPTRSQETPMLKSATQTNPADTAYNFNIVLPGKNGTAAPPEEKKITTAQWIQYGSIALVVVVLLLLLLRKKSPTT